MNSRIALSRKKCIKFWNPICFLFLISNRLTLFLERRLLRLKLILELFKQPLILGDQGRPLCGHSAIHATQSEEHVRQVLVPTLARRRDLGVL